ncbi:MAG TPA: membrane protein insertion efficiency factor YidD [Bacteroidales bacterium]|nr:membrane protein insertion efficiency factor YidD [Bacteroidales bacterium]
MLNTAAKILSFLLLIPVWLYRVLISPWMPPSCRHIPTCSQFTIDALKIHGPFKGLIISTGRILRCRPGGTHGYDPVPLFLFRRYWRAGRWFRRSPRCNRLKERD